MNNNVSGNIELILSNMPDELTQLEKVRWLYINLGKIFCYNLKILENKDVFKKDINYKRGITTYISRYQTCKQISQIFVSILKDLNIEANLIERVIQNRHYTDNHIAFEVIIDKDKYIMDLTLDLYLIQSGCQTKQFGYSNNSNGDYSIIPLVDDKAMDQKLDLIKDNAYTDITISKIKNLTNLEDKILVITTGLNNYFDGSHEALLFYKKVFMETLTENELKDFNTYNLYYINENDINFCSVFSLPNNTIYLYDKNLGFVLTNKEKIKSMLNNGFKTNSNTLRKKLDELENINHNITR